MTVSVGEGRPWSRSAARAAARVMRWVEPEDNPSAVVYGTIAVGLVVAAENPAVETFPRVVGGSAAAMVLYWVAHAYAGALGKRFAGRRRLLLADLPDSLRHEWAIVKGAAAPLLTLLLAWAAGAGLQVAVWSALWTAVAALFLFEVVAAARAKLGGVQLAAGAALGTTLGAALIAVKLLLA
jgi:hypothetical protein